eukprot:COSAG04_NODE_20405_length_394_cov_1.033898_1_plen_24_part_01
MSSTPMELSIKVTCPPDVSEGQLV